MKLSIAAAFVLALVACNHTTQQAATAGPPATGTYLVAFDTTRGPVVINVDRSLAPIGAQHFYELVKAKYFDGARFYRFVPGFVVQWGAAADPAVTKKWSADIPDDPVKGSNTRGTVTFASEMQPNTRSTHLFINLGDNVKLDAMGFAPIGKVQSGMATVDKIYPGYGEHPDQTQIAAHGNAYLEKNFPKLDYIKTAHIVSEKP
ncbi:MAG TPA: peptidylprolyl isomerase [Candidatus Cybelea sp.]|jgi:peptidyl-prolyl cis-trans isomerase A (cyclophilin A)|nr:peptidylprolyl isomerase [Candidatus Cybelea sp.]